MNYYPRKNNNTSLGWRELWGCDWHVVLRCELYRFNLAEQGEGEDKSSPEWTRLLLIDFTGARCTGRPRARGYRNTHASMNAHTLKQSHLDAFYIYVQMWISIECTQQFCWFIADTYLAETNLCIIIVFLLNIPAHSNSFWHIFTHTHLMPTCTRTQNSQPSVFQ